MGEGTKGDPETRLMKIQLVALLAMSNDVEKGFADRTRLELLEELQGGIQSAAPTIREFAADLLAKGVADEPR